MKRSDDRNHVDSSHFAEVPLDVVIIGGGIVGTGIARDASLRGMSVALFESNDLSCGTTSRSSRLIHGGLRYLDVYDFGLVLKDLRERETLLYIAPHLIRPLKFVVPNYEGDFYRRLRLRLGMIVYDLFSTGKSLPSHKMLSSKKVLALESGLKREGLMGGAVFYDCQASFVERIAIENAISAAENGAKLFNHSRVISCEKDQETSMMIVTVEDDLSKERFKIRTKILINATGPWADDVIKFLFSSKTQQVNRLRLTKGIHVAIPKINQNAIILYAKSDQRLFFVLPWFQYTLIGTTDTDYSGDPEKAEASSEDIRYLLTESSAFVHGISANQIRFTYAGIRPLVSTDPRKEESSVSRHYRIVDHSKEGLDGVISVLGVKITSYRMASKETTDLISKKLGRSTKCSTDKVPLPGGRGIRILEEFVEGNLEKLEEFGLDKNQVAHLVGIYGSRVDELIALIEADRKNSERICPNNPDIVAQIALAINQEFALTLSDFLLRRTSIAFSECRGSDCAEKVAAIMARMLNWDDTRISHEISSYKKALELQLPVNLLPTI